MSEMQKFIEQSLLGAAREIAKARGAGLTIKSKGRNDRATSADFAAEKYVVERIARQYPDSIVLSEESYTVSDLNHDSLFVIDPIDGTHNFIQGLPLWGVSVAHYSGGRPNAGGTYFVPQKELYYAEKGKQSTKNGKRINVSKTARLEDFFMLCDSRIHTIEDMGYMKSVLALERMSQHTRFLGSAIYNEGYVACGMADAQFDFKLKPYDFAAGVFIVERAGGRVTDFDGKRYTLETKKFLSSNGRQHARILKILQERKE